MQNGPPDGEEKPPEPQDQQQNEVENLGWFLKLWEWFQDSYVAGRHVCFIFLLLLLLLLLLCSKGE